MFERSFEFSVLFIRVCFEFRSSCFEFSSLHEIDLLALLQRHDRLFPMRLAAEIGAAFALLFAGVIAGVHGHDLLVEEPLDRLLDLDLVGARRNPEHIFVLFLAQQRRLFRQLDCLDEIVRFVHSRFILSARCSNAAGVIKILSNASSCSVFTFAAVASRTGFTFRADRYVFSSNESERTKTFRASVCFFTIVTNAFVFASETANLSTVKTSPALIRSLNAF